MNILLNILVVEDNDDLRDATMDALTTQGHHVTGVDCADAIPELAGLADVDLLVLDVNLPGEDGLSIARRLRQTRPAIGIVMLTARNHSVDKSAGYASGADIYLTKPASLDELNAAIQAIARRLRPNSGEAKSLRLDVASLTLQGALDCVDLTQSEVTTLVVFASAPQQRLEHWQLIEHLGQKDVEYSKSALEVHIVRLRKKLHQADGDASKIKAIRHFGYQLLANIRLV